MIHFTIVYCSQPSLRVRLNMMEMRIFQIHIFVASLAFAVLFHVNGEFVSNSVMKISSEDLIRMVGGDPIDLASRD